MNKKYTICPIETEVKPESAQDSHVGKTSCNRSTQKFDKGAPAIQSDECYCKFVCIGSSNPSRGNVEDTKLIKPKKGSIYGGYRSQVLPTARGAEKQ